MSQSLDDLSGAAIYDILFNDSEEEENMDISNEINDFDMDVSNEINGFCGFTAEDVELSRSKAHNFTYFCNEWMADFNVDTLWTGRNFQNLMFSLQSQHGYIDDNNIIYEFKLCPKYIDDLPCSFTLLENANQNPKCHFVVLL